MKQPRRERACVVCGTSFIGGKDAAYCLACLGPAMRARDAAYRALGVAQAMRQVPLLNGQPCVDCGELAECYDHRDYSKPLQVALVCRSCNKKRGPASEWSFLRAVA